MKKLILTLCLAATGTFAAVAQMRLTLDQALDLALSENPTVKVAEMEVQRYDYVKRQTWGGLLPQVSVTGQVNHSFIVQQMSKGFSLGNDPYTTLSGAVDASVPLFAPQVYRMMKMNDKQMATAVEAARSSRITLTAEVKRPSITSCSPSSRSTCSASRRPPYNVRSTIRRCSTRTA
ncbi:MAG: TolC family protein [Alistipes onderdonkii]